MAEITSYHMISNSHEIVKTLNRDNFVNIEATGMNYIPFESSQWDESNDAKISKFQSLDAEIVSKMSKSLSKNIIDNIYSIGMILLLFDSSWLELSNELLIIRFWSLDAEIYIKYFNY